MAESNKSKGNGGGHFVPKLLGAAAIVALIGTAAIWLAVVRGGNRPVQDAPTFTAKRGPLTISVVESGTIKARDQLIIKNEVKVESSSVCGKGAGQRDLLVELDASALQDSRISRKSACRTPRRRTSAENLAIVSSQADSDVNRMTWPEFAHRTAVRTGPIPLNERVNKRIGRVERRRRSSGRTSSSGKIPLRDGKAADESP
jgi:hypothetical protein